jgi:tRNA-2-methylthio-N6-dimethylallyladenosine synthase
MKYFIQTFGCQANKADSERIAGWLEERNMQPSKNITKADYIVINTCMIRESAENRVYGLVNNLVKASKTVRQLRQKRKLVLTGCMVGLAVRDKSGQFMRKIKKAMPDIDELLPIEEIGFDHKPIRDNQIHAWVPISNGCNNFCTYCVVPFTRGIEISRPFEEIVNEVKDLAKKGYTEVTLIGQNVNSYGSDLLRQHKLPKILKDKNLSPVMVKHLGRLRIPTLFPHLLNEVCKIQGIKKVDFMSSNPWDFSDELIKTIQLNTNIVRHLHLPLQSGDNLVLRRMNRWYTREQYLKLIYKIKKSIPEMTFSTDIIVGFCGETDKQFQNTIDLIKQIGFIKAYISEYSDRPNTTAHKSFKDDVLYKEKKRRWKILDDLINQKSLQKKTYTRDLYTNKTARR